MNDKDTAGKRHAQRHAFALANNLIPKLKQQGITERDLWEAVKSEYGVKSRSEIDEVGYVRLAARLDTAQKHRQMFDSLCVEIKAKNKRPFAKSDEGCYPIFRFIDRP